MFKVLENLEYIIDKSANARSQGSSAINNTNK